MSILFKSPKKVINFRNFIIFNRNKNKINSFNFTQKRTFIIGRIISGVFRLRYLAIASTAGGGYYVNKKYEQIKDAFPDLGKFKIYLPEPERIDNFVYLMRSKMHNISDLNKNMMSQVYTGVEEQYKNFEQWIKEKSSEVAKIALEYSVVEDKNKIKEIEQLEKKITILDEKFTVQSESVENDQPEMAVIQLEHERDKHRLEDEIKELKKQLLYNKQRRSGRKLQIKKSLIEMYSEVLDQLSQYDSKYSIHDHLPRVVVVGEQSAGKTSVLEMVAQSRLFPRGAGTMMTKAPVQVTLAEGPFPVARFDTEDGPEFDLSTEQGQAALRAEIEMRMDQLAGLDSITKQPISLSVKGPNLNRLVLVDLPGVINTTTTGMQTGTKDAVLSLAKHYMSNPNAIILCIQDASKDAESSSIVDLVSSMDPMGKRTIFVLTKVDQAETQLSDPNRIKDILSGKVFKMKALGYFAVITGKGNNDESISTIKEYEEDFFKKSKLFRDGVMKSNQMTTRNLSKAVSDRFWKMVQESVEHQADSFKALKFNMENEWRHKYTGLRELDRVELFERAKGEILDNLIKLSTISPTKWENDIVSALWNKIKDNVFEDIYIPSHESSSSVGHYKTTMENQLKPWADKKLTKDTVDIGWEVMKNTLVQISKEKSSKATTESDLFKDVQLEVQNRSFDLHKWDTKADSSLKIIQSEALNDIPIKSKSEWDNAVKFLSSTLDEHISSIKKTKNSLKGPYYLESWTSWTSRTPIQKKRCAVFDEIKNILDSEPDHKMTLTAEEVTTMKRNLKMKKVEVDSEFIRDLWLISYKESLFEKARSRAKDCQKGFYHYHYGFADKADFDCRDVVFFRRILRMLETSAGALRNQIMNNEMRRMERIVKEVLYEIGADSKELKKLLVGDRVQLAENLKKVRLIQEKLDEFISALNKDK